MNRMLMLPQYRTGGWKAMGQRTQLGHRTVEEKKMYREPKAEQ